MDATRALPQPDRRQDLGAYFDRAQKLAEDICTMAGVGWGSANSARAEKLLLMLASAPSHTREWLLKLPYDVLAEPELLKEAFDDTVGLVQDDRTLAYLISRVRHAARAT